MDVRDLAGKRLGDFELVRELGRGGMGVVYEARQVSLNRRVALKVLAGGLGLSAKVVQRFRREAEAAAKLHHTNIVPVYATGAENGTHFYAMELIDGPSLDLVIRQMREASGTRRAGQATISATVNSPDLEATCPYPREAGSLPTLSASSLSSDGHYFDTVARLVAGVADALEYAHQQGVIHRDIKPSNLMLAPAGRLSLNDFGLARMLEQPGMTMSGEFVGTPRYMSPEQITAGRIPLDQRTDIYSLGATLYELLTLEPPHQGESREQVLAQIVQKEPVAPRRVQKKVPVDLETICLKCLEKDPDRRYQSAGDLAADLRRYVDRFAISARRAGPVQRLGKWARRHPGLSVASLCGLVLALIAGLLAYRLQVETRNHEQQLQEHKRQQALDKALVAANSGEFAAADAAVDEAELVGASPGQVHILRGQVALDRGDLKAGRQHLQQAVKLLPNSVAPRAALALAYWDAGDWPLYVQTLHELERLSPVTPEDYLFKGRIESRDDPARGLVSLEEAVRRLPGSGMARLARADAQAYYAQITARPEDAELAIRYANTAKDMLPNNPMALVTSTFAHLTAATTFGESDQPDKRDHALEQAGRDVKALQDRSTPARVLWMRLDYLDFLGDGHNDALLKECRRIEQTTDDPSAMWFCVSRLYRLGQFEEARKLVEQRLPRAVSKIDYLVQKGFVVAELANGEVEAANVVDAVLREVPRTPPTAAAPLGPHTLLRYLGRKPQAEEACRQIRARLTEPFPYRPEWNNKLLDYNCGELTEQQLLQAAGSSRWDQCEGHFHMALTKLADGNRAGAKAHFRQAIETGVFFFFEYRWSRAFLARMEDPKWPPWIAQK